MLCSQYLPAWYLGTFPDHRIILASYEASFAADWGRKARNILNEWGPSVFGLKVSDSPASADHWNIAGREGGMQTAGVGGPITGKGANLIVVDDPCIAAGQPVQTLHGLIPIEQVRIGDMVLTHRKRWRRVTATDRKSTRLNSSH